MTRDEAIQKLLGVLSAKEREQDAKKEDAKAHRDALADLAKQEEDLREFLEQAQPLENLR
jgi:hypothetical protein